MGLCIVRRAVRRDDDIGRVPKERIEWKRLRVEDVKDRARQASAGQRGAQGRVINNCAARNVCHGSSPQQGRQEWRLLHSPSVTGMTAGIVGVAPRSHPSD